MTNWHVYDDDEPRFGYRGGLTSNLGRSDSSLALQSRDARDAEYLSASISTTTMS